MTPAAEMTKIERVRAALAGAPVDHPPFTVWLKAMNDYFAALSSPIHSVIQ